MLTCYENAHIFTADTQHASCFVVHDDRFVFVGEPDEAHHLYPDALRIDLKNQFACPGFNDSHMHLLELGCVLMQAQLNRFTNSLSHVLKGVKEYADNNPHECWVLGRGWNHDFFEDEQRYPNRWDLDHICPDRPCLITRACGHVAVANSAALRIAGIDTLAPVVEGGCVVTDPTGMPTGVLEENAIGLVSRLIPAPDRAGIKKRLLLAMETAAGYGITSVQTDDFCALEVPFEDIIAAYLELKAEGRMTVRVTEQCLLPTEEALDHFLRLGYRSGWGDEWFRIGPLKLLTDGSLGAHTAYLQQPYTDMPDTQGIATYTQETLNTLVLKAHRAGMQIAAHAIGDGAADLVLNAIEYAQNQYPRKNTRHGIVHAQVLTHKQAQRMKGLEMHAYIQPIFLDYDTQIVHPRLGSRAFDAYPAKTFQQLGVTYSGGSDCPVEPCNVLKGIQCAVTRKSVSMPQEEAYLPSEALSVHDALLLFTADGAYASFEEDEKGRIACGNMADFVILSCDPFETDPLHLHSIPIIHTFINGKKLL